MRLSELIQRLERHICHSEDQEVVIPVTDHGGVGRTPAVPLESADCGIDWDKGRVFLRPRQPLSRLSREDVQAVHDSLRGAQNWHAYQAHKAMMADVRAAQDQAHAAEKRAADREEQARVYRDIAVRALGPEEFARQLAAMAPCHE